MNAQFAKWGNSLALRIPSPLARELHVSDGKNAELRVEGGSLVVTPVDVAPVYDINELVQAITAENVHAEFDTGPAVGNEFA